MNTRRAFFRSLLGSLPELCRLNTESETEPDYTALLPPDFTPTLLRMEAERLGLDADTLTRNELAKRILEQLQGEGVMPCPETETRMT